jgi:hypothetical protein
MCKPAMTCIAHAPHPSTNYARSCVSKSGWFTAVMARFGPYSCYLSNHSACNDVCLNVSIAEPGRPRIVAAFCHALQHIKLVTDMLHINITIERSNRVLAEVVLEDVQENFRSTGQLQSSVDQPVVRLRAPPITTPPPHPCFCSLLASAASCCSRRTAPPVTRLHGSLLRQQKTSTRSSAMMSGDADGTGNADTAVVQGGTACEGIWQGRP